MLLRPVPLEGAFVRVVPLSEELVPRAVDAALSSPATWKHIPRRMDTRDEARAAFVEALARQARGEAIAQLTCLRDTGEIVGGSNIRLVDPLVPSVEIGGTWIVARWQRTAVNTAVKLLQLAHCFDVLGCARVELKTDIDNLASLAAIARIGAKQEGILRSHMKRANGTLRDTVYFSIVRDEWPEVRTRLDAMCARRS